MNKYLLFLLPLLGFSTEIQIEKTKLKPLGKIIQTNAKIIQLSQQKQEIVSRLSGHLEDYYVQAGAYVKAGEKIALIESIALSKMTAEYLSLVQQTKVAKVQKDANSKLNKKGLSSQNDLNNAIIALEEIRSKQNALASQLHSLGISPASLHKATDKLIIYAHADGLVGKILAPLHSNVDAKTRLMTLVNQDIYHVIAYLSVKDALKISKETKAWIHIAKQNYSSSFVQLLPNIDQETQRAKVIFTINHSPKNLLLGTFIKIDISLAPTRHVVMVKKSALTLFQGEWVIFTPKENEEEHHDDEVDHKNHKEDSHEEHDNHEKHEEETSYQPNVVNILAYVGNDVAIQGLKNNVDYVSEGVYFVKSMLLKSSLGEHGH